MYPIILGEMGQILKLSKRELESDIREIAEYWEACLEKANIADRDTAIFLLTTCVNCYLRGKGIHLENYQLFKKNNGVLVSLVTLVPLYAWSQPAGNFCKVYELMPIEAYKPDTALDDIGILAEAEKILQEKWKD
jgi:hypothetical protein